MKKSDKIEAIEKAKKYKLRNFRYSELALKTGILSEKGHMRALNCGSYLELLGDFNMEQTKVVKAHLCHGRWCPICAKAKVQADAKMILSLIQAVKLKDKKEFLFLTLTVPNVKGMDLRKTTDFLYRSFNKFMRYKDVAYISKGFIRKLEVTYNSKKDTYHPHIHAIIAVNKTYFKSKEYLKRDKWLAFWQRATGMDNITQVDVRRAKFTSTDDAMELATYSAKMGDVLDNGEEVFRTFANHLYRVRSFGFGGLFKTYKAMFDKKTLDVPLLEEKENEDEWYWLLQAVWQYQEKEYQVRQEKIKNMVR